MEDVLEVYHRPQDPDRPVVCLDETSVQSIAETRVPIAAKPGQPERYNYEYEHNGTANLFMLFAPLEGWRHVEAIDHHAALDYAQNLEGVEDRVGADNLNTTRRVHSTKPFPAAEVRCLVERFEWHYTPKHGSWLDMTESELGVLSSKWLDRGIPDKQTLTEEVAAREGDRNRHHAKANWQFTSADARGKLKRLSPRYEPLRQPEGCGDGETCCHRLELRPSCYHSLGAGRFVVAVPPPSLATIRASQGREWADGGPARLDFYRTTIWPCMNGCKPQM
jgi:hypothetical protein